MQIKLNEVVDALEKTSVEQSYYYFIPEERIIEYDEQIDSSKLLPLPTNKQKDDYGIMMNFIDSLSDGDAKEWLLEAIKGAGAFRRFRSTLERFNMLDQWYDFKEEAYEDLAIEWCNYYGVEYLSDNPFETVKEKPEVVTPLTRTQEFHLININEDNIYGLAYLVKNFRETLAKFKDLKIDFDVDEAVEELKYYINNSYPIYAISCAGKFIAYEVLKIQEDVVWVESIYVLPEYRKKGVGRMLLEKADEVSKEYHNDSLYFNVHPNNHEMIAFLNKNGYDVLNLIEIRKAYPSEENNTSYLIDGHTYKY